MRGSNYLDSVLFDLAITHLATVRRGFYNRCKFRGGYIDVCLTD